MTTFSRQTPAWSFVALATAATSAAAIAVWPAHAEDSGFWDAIRAMRGASESVAPSAPMAPSPSIRRAAPRVQSAARPSPQVARLPETPTPPRVLKPADPSQRPNPLATLLSDPTLRKGDIVMFPDGPRVFRGEPGKRHAAADFVALSKAKDMAKSTRKMLAGLPVGENSAWSSDTIAATGRLAQGGADVETTGSVSRSRSRR